MRIQSLIVPIAVSTLSTPVLSDTPFQLDLCTDSRTSGWSFYCKPPQPDPIDEELASPEPAPATPATTHAPEPVDPGEIGRAHV